MAKATKLTMIRREKAIQEMMSQGIDRTTICETLAAKEKVSAKSIERQYYQIVGAMERLVTENRSELRANLMARQEAIFKKSMEDAKYKTALDATVAQAKLGGLNETVSEETKRPEVITMREKDFSGSLEVVKPKAENE